MKFSILVPVYNVEKYLEQCVESLLGQTYKGDYEIILVDDGSTDSSGYICDRYAEIHRDKITVIHKANGGHTSARLAAINAATGEFCLFCDSDDFVESNLLETVDSTLQNNPGTDMVIYSFSYYEDGKKIPRTNYTPGKSQTYEGESKKKICELLITTPYINSLWTKAIKTVFLKNDPTDYSVTVGKDIAEDAFTVSYFLTVCKKIVNIDNSLYNYRTNRESISRSYDIQKIDKKNTLYVYERFRNYLPVWGMNTEEYRQKLNARWLNEVMYTFSQYYENVHSRKERKEVLNYNWSSMLPEEVVKSTDNPYENKALRKLFSCISQKRFLRLKIHFSYKKFYKNYRKIS